MRWPPTNSSGGSGSRPTAPMSDAPSDPRFPARKRPVHPLPVDSADRSTIIFLTVCTRERRRVLGNETAHEQLQLAWRTADRWLVGQYLVMPDHIHLFCSPAAIPPYPLDAWVRYWKSLTTKTLGYGES